jgi:hypothetical protein
MTFRIDWQREEGLRKQQEIRPYESRSLLFPRKTGTEMKWKGNTGIHDQPRTRKLPRPITLIGIDS